MITIQTQKDALKETQKKLKYLQQKSPSAIANAINRAATTVNAAIKQEVRKDYYIKAGDIQATLTKTKATRAKLGAEVWSKGKPISLDKFRVSPKTPNPNRKAPIKVAVKKDGGLKALTGAFVADMNGAKLFKREGKSRLPIKKLFGPSIPQMVGNEEVKEKIDNAGQDMLHKRLDHEINRVLEKGRG